MIPDLRISALSAAYGSGETTPREVCADLRRRAADAVDRNVFIRLFDGPELERWLAPLDGVDPATLPLYGVPFALKDNIDLAGIPTTAGCAAFAYVPDEDAFVAARLIAAGAVPIGKTNLDQFATGLNGTRSPFGPCRNAFDPAYVSGGSSAGSAVAVALGLASFSLGTDTAGSGRVPAGFNNLVGLKPTRGLLSASGVVPACRSLDCVSVFALDADDANRVLAVAAVEDADDCYGRRNPVSNAVSTYGRHAGALRLGVPAPDALRFFGDAGYEAAWHASLATLEGDGVELVELDYAPFDETARLLYEGPWVAERYVATQPLIDDDPGAIFPVVRDIIAPGGTPKAADLFRALYRLESLKKRCAAELDGLDAMLTPTSGRHFTIEEMLEEPIRRNSELGHYTNFVNLLDLSAVAVPARMTEAGLPFGITLVGPTFGDRALLSIANRIQTLMPLPRGASTAAPAALTSTPSADASGRIDLVVCGAHLDGMPLNGQLVERGARLVAATRTSPEYRLHALPDGARPALVHDAAAGRAIEVEVWSMPATELGGFLAGIAAPLGLGKVRLEGGGEATGFIAEPRALDGATDISEHGGWRAWRASVRGVRGRAGCRPPASRCRPPRHPS